MASGWCVVKHHTHTHYCVTTSSNASSNAAVVNKYTLASSGELASGFDVMKHHTHYCVTTSSIFTSNATVVNKYPLAISGDMARHDVLTLSFKMLVCSYV
jgi:hypothetical protein